jgi:hypothetical protein
MGKEMVFWRTQIVLVYVDGETETTIEMGAIMPV